MEPNNRETIQQVLSSRGKNRDDLLEQLWECFADTPVDLADNIEEQFFIWEVGMPKLEIWEWFDERHSKGVAYMVFGVQR